MTVAGVWLALQTSTLWVVATAGEEQNAFARRVSAPEKGRPDVARRLGLEELKGETFVLYASPLAILGPEAWSAKQLMDVAAEQGYGRRRAYGDLDGTSRAAIARVLRQSPLPSLEQTAQQPGTKVALVFVLTGNAVKGGEKQRFTAVVPALESVLDIEGSTSKSKGPEELPPPTGFREAFTFPESVGPDLRHRLLIESVGLLTRRRTEMLGQVLTRWSAARASFVASQPDFFGKWSGLDPEEFAELSPGAREAISRTAGLGRGPNERPQDLSLYRIVPSNLALSIAVFGPGGTTVVPVAFPRG